MDRNATPLAGKATPPIGISSVNLDIILEFNFKIKAREPHLGLEVKQREGTKAAAGIYKTLSNTTTRDSISRPNFLSSCRKQAGADINCGGIEQREGEKL